MRLKSISGNIQYRLPNGRTASSIDASTDLELVLDGNIVRVMYKGKPWCLIQNWDSALCFDTTPSPQIDPGLIETIPEQKTALEQKNIILGHPEKKKTAVRKQTP